MLGSNPPISTRRQNGYFSVRIGGRDWLGGGVACDSRRRLEGPQALQAAPSKFSRRSIREWAGHTKLKTQNSKLKTLTPRCEPPSCHLVLLFGEEFVPDLPVLGLVAVVLQLRHLATDIN